MKVFLLFCLFFIFSFKSVYAVAPDNYVWTKQNDGLSGSNVVDVVTHPTDSNIVYLVTSTRGVYKSTDAGVNWTAKNTGLPTNPSVNFAHLTSRVLTIDPNNPNTLYVQIGGLVYKTTDGGDNWTSKNTGIVFSCGNPAIIGVLVDNNNSNHLFAASITSGCSGGVWESSDAGENWTQTAGINSTYTGNINGFGSNDAWPLAIDQSDPTKLYFSVVHAVKYRTTDGGDNWSAMTFPTDYNSSDGVDNTVRGTTNEVFVGLTNGMLKSTDYGQNWSAVSTFSGLYVSAIEFAPSNQNIGYVLASGKVYATTDGGANWTIASTSSYSIWSIAIDYSDPAKIYVGTSNYGILKSTDSGVNLSLSNTGLPVTINTRILDSYGDTLIGTFSGAGTVRSADNGYTWTTVSATSLARMQRSRSNTSVLYANAGASVYKSTDDGQTWTLSTTFTGQNVISLGIHPTDPNIVMVVVYDSPLKIAKTTDGGTNWTTPAAFGQTSLYTAPNLFYDSNIPANVYIGGYGNFYKSTDGGDTWADSSTGVSGRWFDVVMVEPRKPGLILGGMRGGDIIYSTDYGANWSNSNIIGAGSVIQSFSFDPSDANTIYTSVSSTRVIYKSTDAGVTWTTFTGSGITSDATITQGIVVDTNNSNRIYVGTSSNGFYIYENYIPNFSTSTFTAADNSGGATFEPGDIVDFTITVSNSGPAVGTSPTATAVLPENGLTLISNSIKRDGAVISPQPISGRTLAVPLSSLYQNESFVITFQMFIDNSAPQTIVVDPVITSSEDTSGTTIPDLTISLSRVNAGTVSAGGGSENCLEGWVYCILAGPKLKGLSKFLSGDSENKARVFIDKDAHHDDIYLTIERVGFEKMPRRQVPYPWEQGLNAVSEIYEIKAYSSFNGYPIPKLDKKAILQINFNTTSLVVNKFKFLKIARYDPQTKKWNQLKNQMIVNPWASTIATTLDSFGMFAATL